MLSRVGQPESANAISTSADPPVTMPTEEGMTTAAASAEYAAYQSTAGATSPSPLVQRFGPLCPPMKSRTAAARPGAEGGEAAGAAAAAATPAAAAGAMAGRVAVASSATILNPQAPHQARLPIGTAMSELAHGATAESELGATAAVPTVPALHHCHYSGEFCLADNLRGRDRKQSKKLRAVAGMVMVAKGDIDNERQEQEYHRIMVYFILFMSD